MREIVVTNCMMCINIFKIRLLWQDTHPKNNVPITFDKYGISEQEEE